MSRLTCIMIRTAHPLYFISFPVFFLFVPALRAGAGSYRFDFNAECRKAYEEIIKLQAEHRRQISKSEKKSDPGNLIPYFLENYIDFFTLFFNEDPGEYRRRKPFSRTTTCPDEKRRSLLSLLSFYPFRHLFSMGGR